MEVQPVQFSCVDDPQIVCGSELHAAAVWPEEAQQHQVLIAPYYQGGRAGLGNLHGSGLIGCFVNVHICSCFQDDPSAVGSQGNLDHFKWKLKANRLGLLQKKVV